MTAFILIVALLAGVYSFGDKDVAQIQTSAAEERDLRDWLRR